MPETGAAKTGAGHTRTAGEAAEAHAADIGGPAGLGLFLPDRRGDLTAECGAAVAAVLEALGKKHGPEDTRTEDTRTEAQRFHDALQLGWHAAAMPSVSWPMYSAVRSKIAAVAARVSMGFDRSCLRIEAIRPAGPEHEND